MKNILIGLVWLAITNTGAQLWNIFFCLKIDLWQYIIYEIIKQLFISKLTIKNDRKVEIN